MWLRKHEWEAEAVEYFSEAIKTAFLDPERPNGIRLHVIDVFLDELLRAEPKILSSSSVLQLLEPVLDGLGGTPDDTFFKRVVQSVVLKLHEAMSNVASHDFSEVVMLMSRR